MNLRRMTAGWQEPSATAVLEHGANPGLISHWTKQGLLDIAQRLLDDRKVQGGDADELRQLVRDQTFNRLAMKLGVKVIHCSERDTQVTSQPKQVDEFVNTWSIEGFREEGITTAEMGWGTHEKQLPPLTYHHPNGPRNQICLARMGMNTWVVLLGPPILHSRHDHPPRRGVHDLRSAHGLGRWPADLPPHGALRLLSLRRRHRIAGGASRQRLRVAGEAADHARRNHRRGRHSGALLMGHAYHSWWTGSMLTIEQSRRLVPHQNATTMQVAISVVAAATWMVENPQRGVCSPDDLPHEYVLEIARPYLGQSVSVPSDWTPLKYYVNNFHGFNQPDIDFDDPWQFKNFLITDGD